MLTNVFRWVIVGAAAIFSLVMSVSHIAISVAAFLLGGLIVFKSFEWIMNLMF